MKAPKIFFLSFLCFVLFTLNVVAQEGETGADDSRFVIDSRNMPYERTPINKLGRGIINFFTCWMEIPAEAYKVSQDKNALTGCTLGVVEGVGTALIRGLSGAFDAVTFIIPPYDKPLMTPEYALDSAMEKFQYHKEE